MHVSVKGKYRCSVTLEGAPDQQPVMLFMNPSSSIRDVIMESCKDTAFGVNVRELKLGQSKIVEEKEQLADVFGSQRDVSFIAVAEANNAEA